MIEHRGNVRPDEKPELGAFALDDLLFVPQPGDAEQAFRGGAFVGELGADDIDNNWRARKADGDWKPMRSRAEARAYLVSKIRT